jgi:hypothetical protein
MICEPSNFSALEFQTKCSRKLIAFELLEDITNKLVIRICQKAFLIDLKFVLAQVIKEQFNGIIVLIKSYKLDYWM